MIGNAYNSNDVLTEAHNETSATFQAWMLESNLPSVEKQTQTFQSLNKYAVQIHSPMGSTVPNISTITKVGHAKHQERQKIYQSMKKDRKYISVKKYIYGINL